MIEDLDEIATWFPIKSLDRACADSLPGLMHALYERVDKLERAN